MQIHHYDQEMGAYLGSSPAELDPLDPTRWLMPAQSTTKAPMSAGPGEFAAWTGSAWELRAVQAPAAEPAPIVQSRAQIIRARLKAIDAEGVRAMRSAVAAMAKGKPVPAFDANKMDALETEAAALRAELAGL